MILDRVVVRQFYAITGGGSTLDILACTEDEALAQAIVDEWRKFMGIDDDGWDVQTLDVWDRMPDHWSLWIQRAEIHDFRVKLTESKHEIWEWEAERYAKRETTVTWNTHGGGHGNVMIQGADRDDVGQLMRVELEVIAKTWPADHDLFRSISFGPRVPAFPKQAEGL